jgi:translation initiation factor 3 subunit J
LPAAPPKKKGTIKAKLAEKEAAKAARRAAGEEDSDLEYDSDEVLDPREKARRDKEKELNSDLANAAALLGSAGLGGIFDLPHHRTSRLSDGLPLLKGTSSSELDSLVSADPRTKEDFQSFSINIIEYIIKRHQHKPLYASFVEQHVRALAEPLKDIEVRKAASGLTTLANEKQKEQRDKASGKKKPKAKPGLGAAKLVNK